MVGWDPKESVSWASAAVRWLDLVMASGAQAGPLASASLSLQIFGDSFTFPSAGATGTATSSAHASLGGSGVFVGTQTTLHAGRNFTYFSVIVTQDQGGIFAGAAPSKLAGSAPVRGRFGGHTYAGFSTLFLPFTVGKQANFTVMGSGMGFSLAGAPWTAGLVTISGVTTTGFWGSLVMSGTLMVGGLNGLSPEGAGILTLVSPQKVILSTGEKYLVLGTLTLTYVPEPSTALLLGTGALGLAALGRRRRASGPEAGR